MFFPVSSKTRLLLLLLALVGAPLYGAVIYPRLLDVSKSRSAPYKFVGQLLFTSGSKDYVGSGSVIKPKSVLTAGHNVYDAEGGWSVDIRFNRAQYGATALGTYRPNHIYLLGGYQQSVQAHGPDDVLSFAYDAAGLAFAAPVTGGSYLGYTTNTAWLNAGNFQMAVGYAAEGNHDGDHPFVEFPTHGFSRTAGGFWESPNVYFEGGMSGGPLLVPGYYGTQVAAIVVSSSTDPVYGGIRVVDGPLATLINTQLH